ncbi:MAG TPA: TonB-dependent receptor, partial [Kiritimatiellia bacterium]
DARVSWTPDPDLTAWASVARAVRIPSRLEADSSLRVTNALTSASNISLDTSGFDSEELVSYQTGLRTYLARSVLVDLAVFYNDYDNLQSVEGNLSSLENNTFGESYGGGASATWQALDWWQFIFNYSYFRMNLEVESGSDGGPAAEGAEENDPQNTANVRSHMQVTRTVQFDAGLRYVDELSSRGVPEYLVADLRLAWMPVKDLELAIVGRNLLDNHHPEQPLTGSGSEVENSVYGKVTWAF